MQFRSPSSPFVPLAFCALIPCITLSNACARSHRGEVPEPLIPMVAPIPVAPTPSVPSVPVAVTRPTPSIPRAAVAAEVAARPGPVEEVPAAMPAQHVVIVDELPYRWSREATRDASDRPSAGGKRRGRKRRPYHPAPGIIVDVAEAQGGVAAAEIQRSARNAGYWPFRRCYEEGLRRDQGLSGKVSVDLSIVAGGAVERTSIVSTTLRDESVVLCIGREASHLALSPGAAGGPPVEAKMDVTLATGDAPVSVPPPVPRAGELRDALRASWPAVTQCYASSLAKHANTGGRLELLFRTKSTGEIVEVAEEGETRFADVDVTRCVLGVYRTSKLSSDVCSPSFAYAMHFEAGSP